MVPLFQRPYTWGEKQWKTLWEDLVDFYDLDPTDQKSTHFMGAIVTMPARSVPVGVSKFLVIDGQQRLTTIAVLMAAIRDALSPTEPAYRRIQTHYLTNEGYAGTDHLKLLPTQADRPLFSPLVESPGAEVPASGFRKAYDYFRSRFKTTAFALHGNEHLAHHFQCLSLAGSLHLVDHRSTDETGAYSVHTNAASCILESCTLRQTDHAMLRRVIRPALIAPDETSQRGTVDDGATPLFAHHLQLEFHAAPNAPQIDRHDAVVVIAR